MSRRVPLLHLPKKEYELIIALARPHGNARPRLKILDFKTFS
jgi:hypothetical protein